MGQMDRKVRRERAAANAAGVVEQKRVERKGSTEQQAIQEGMAGSGERVTSDTGALFA